MNTIGEDRTGGTREHEFDEVYDTCIHCGASLTDAHQDKIGCEAGPEGNPPSYKGLALTPAEQDAGLTTMEKWEQSEKAGRDSPSA